MIVPIETYRAQGERAGRAMRHQDMGTYRMLSRWCRDALGLEDVVDRADARAAWVEGYQRGSPARPFEPFR